MILAFRVIGDPKPKGSKTTGVAKNGMRYVRESNDGTMKWVSTVRAASRRVMGHEVPSHQRPPSTGPVKVDLLFHMKRPKNHYASDGSLKWWAPLWHQTRPDADKLVRAVLDGLQPYVLKDDSQAASLKVNKCYVPLGMEPGVMIEIRELA